MGSHVSVIPNHQVFRKTPLHTRANVAYFGTFGYELDLNSLKEEEIAAVKEQIIFKMCIRDRPKNLIRPIQQIQRGIQTQRVALGKNSRMERAKGNQYLSNSIFNEKNVSGIHGKSVVSLMEDVQKDETNIENNKDNLPDKDFLPSNFLQNIGKRTQSRFVPAGQSTQMIIGASGESDFHLL